MWRRRWMVGYVWESVHLGNRQLSLSQLEDKICALTLVVRVQKAEFLRVVTLHLYTCVWHVFRAGSPFCLHTLMHLLKLMSCMLVYPSCIHPSENLNSLPFVCKLISSLTYTHSCVLKFFKIPNPK